MSLTQLPKISIITPTFNQGAYIERTITSVLDQNYPNLEYFIFDAGSRDETIDIIKKYESRITYWESEKDRGQSHAINKGLSRVTGDIVAWINSDDWYELGTFKIVAEKFRQDPRALLAGKCTCHYDHSSREKIIDPAKPSLDSMLRYWNVNFCPPQPSIFFPAKILKEVGLLNEALIYALDLDLWLRMAKLTKFVTVPENLSHYLIHQTSKSGSSDGFGKFRAEWKQVCFQHARTSPFLTRLSFFAAYCSHYLRHLTKLALNTGRSSR